MALRRSYSGGLAGWLAATATAAAAASVLVVILDFLFAHHHIAEVHEN